MDKKLSKIIYDVVQINKESITKNKGEGRYFNLIKLMGMASSEVHPHTPIIADSLNPNGQHGQGDIFLKFFLNLFSIDFSLDSKVKVEREKRSKNDQIDILIENDSQIIIIENKIYAIDQEKQLYRYYEYCIRQKKQPILIYLSMQNSNPSKRSLCKITRGQDGNYYLNESNLQKVELKVLNYQDDLLGWLDIIKKYSLGNPNLNSGIEQYINLILQMTGQIMTNKSEIKNLLKNIQADEFKAISDVCNVYRSSDFRGELLSSFFDSVSMDITSFEEFSISTESEFINLDKIHYNLTNCKKWFKSKNVNKRKSRDFIGVIFDSKASNSLKFFVVVITEAMYYGFFVEDDLFNLEILNEDSIWTMNSTTEKLGKTWFGKKVCNVWDFDVTTVELLNTKNNDNYEQFIKNVISDFNFIGDKFKQSHLT